MCRISWASHTFMCRKRASHLAVPTLLLWTDDGAAISTKSTPAWLWQFGRGKPRLGGLSVEQTGERKKVASDARHKRAAETKRARKTA